MGTWLVPRESLTPGQLDAVDLDLARHHVITGGPGSGKTLVLVHRAAQLLRERGVGAERLRVVVFTNVLRDFIRSALEFLGIPETTVLTFDHLCREYWTEYVSASVPWKSGEKGPDFEAIRAGVLRDLTARRASPQFDVILVDEAQDLDAAAFEILKRMSRHVTAVLDERQRIFDHGASEREIVQALGLRDGSLRLIDTYRCCPYIAELAAEFITDPRQRTIFRNQTRMAQGAKETPLLFLAQDLEEEKRQLALRIVARVEAGDRVAVLLPQRRQVFGFQKGLAELGVNVEVQSNRWKPGRLAHEIDFGSDMPKMLTYHSAKGLTFESVFLPRLVPGSFAKTTDEAALFRQMFIGITRATRWVYLSSDDPDSLPLFAPLRMAERNGTLTVKTKTLTAVQPKRKGKGAGGGFAF